MSNDPPQANDEMVYNRPGGMTEHERAKIRRRLGGGSVPNASGARGEAPAILAGSEPSRELVKPKLTPEEEAIAAANRAARAPVDLPPDPVNGVVDPLDQVHEAALTDDELVDEVLKEDFAPLTSQERKEFEKFLATKRAAKTDSPDQVHEAATSVKPIAGGEPGPDAPPAEAPAADGTPGTPSQDSLLD